MSLLVWDQRDSPQPGPLNMAWDEALLESATQPILRLYSWDGPWVSCGYFQKLEDAASQAKGRPIVRRWTGGGMVFHGDDSTFSLIVPSGQPLATVRPQASYQAIHRALVDALMAEGLVAGLASGAPQGGGGACFTQPVPNDVILGGIKVAGGAQRRTRHGLLHQGSVLLPKAHRVSMTSFPMHLAAMLGGTGWTGFGPDSALTSRAEELARNRYGTASFSLRGAG